MTLIPIGVSACLLGHPVRYDGEHQHEPLITATLGRFCELIPVCPEFDSGLGAPRETMRLVGEVTAPRLLTSQSAIDRTAQLQAWIDGRIEQLIATPLAGFILKAKSPSCGLTGVKLYPSPGLGEDFERIATGLFAQALRRRLPFLPLIDELGLHDLAQRQLFIDQAMTYHRSQPKV